MYIRNYFHFITYQNKKLINISLLDIWSLLPLLRVCAVLTRGKSGRKGREIKYLRSLICLLLHCRRKSRLLIIKVDNFARSFSVDYNCGWRLSLRGSCSSLLQSKYIIHIYESFVSLLLRGLRSNFLFLDPRGS